MTQHRITTNAKPADGHRPADWPNPRRGTIRLALLCAALFIVLVTVGSETGRAILMGVPV